MNSFATSSLICNILSVSVSSCCSIDNIWGVNKTTNCCEKSLGKKGEIKALWVIDHGLSNSIPTPYHHLIYGTNIHEKCFGYFDESEFTSDDARAGLKKIPTLF